MQQMSSQMQQYEREWRRSKVLELSSQGHSEREIASRLQMHPTTVHRDLAFLRRQAQENLKTRIHERLPEQYQNCMVGINQVLKICWEIVNKSRNVDNDNGNSQTMTVIDNKTVLQALALINDCNKYKMDLTTNGVVITDAIKFVQTNKDKLAISTKEDDNESKESDYDEDKDQLEEKQEEETGEQETTNQVF
jgi:hypothetical protein